MKNQSVIIPSLRFHLSGAKVLFAFSKRNDQREWQCLEKTGRNFPIFGKTAGVSKWPI
jgi:hypothetical protein